MISNKNTRAAYYRAVCHFFAWLEQHGIDELVGIEPLHVAAYIEQFQHAMAKPTVKQHLAAIRMLFDWLVVGQVLATNPAHAVRGPKHVVKRGKTPVLTADQARRLLDSIDVSTLVGLRDRALIGVMTYAFARVGAVVAMRVEDYYPEGKRWWLRLWSYYATQDTLPTRFLWIAGSWFILSVCAVAFCPLATGPAHYGKAKWAKGRFRLWRLGLTASHGVVVGTLGGRVLHYNVPLSTLLLAPAGTGKTRGTIIPTVLSYRGSVIVHDPKGEVYDNSAGYRATRGRVLRVEWSAPARSLCWNPLSPATCQATPAAGVMPSIACAPSRCPATRLASGSRRPAWRSPPLPCFLSTKASARAARKQRSAGH
jgi:hypothetical protein